MLFAKKTPAPRKTPTPPPPLFLCNLAVKFVYWIWRQLQRIKLGPLRAVLHKVRQKTESAIYIMIFPCKLAKIAFSVLMHMQPSYICLFWHILFLMCEISPFITI